MALSEHSSEMENLFEILERSKEEPWMMCVPLPRVLQIMSQTISLSMEDKTKNYPEVIQTVCAACDNYPRIPKEFLSTVLRDPKSLDILIKTRKEILIPNQTLAFILRENNSLFEKLHLELFKNVGQAYSDNIFQTENKSAEFCKEFLGHKCLKSSHKTNFTNSDIYLCYSLASNKDLFQLSLSIQNAFLKHCNFSIISIKIINIFAQEIAKHTKQWCDFFPVEFVELLYLINNPPCVKCNAILSTKADLEILTEQVDLSIKILNIDEVLRIVLCIYCDWLVHCSHLSSVRTLFINYPIL